MKPTWIFSDCSNQGILEYVEDNRYPVIKLGSYYDYKNDKPKLHIDGPIVIEGTIPMCKQLNIDYPHFVPGVIGIGNPMYNCDYYYKELNNFLLNKKYTFTTLGFLNENYNNMFNEFAIQDAVFVRPVDNEKSFTGKLIFKERINDDLKSLTYNDDMDLKIIIAEPITILGEWRFVICDRIPIAASMYRMNGNSIRLEGAPDKAWDLAREVSSGFNPDRVWILDICQAKYDNNYYVLEIGGFSGSGLYNCNPKDVVENVSKIAIDEYNKLIRNI